MIFYDNISIDYRYVDKIIHKPLTQALATTSMVCEAILRNTELGIGYLQIVGWD